jgi:endoglucanase
MPHYTFSLLSAHVGRLALSAAFILSAMACHSHGAAAAECRDRQTSVPVERVRILARGFNLTGWLSGETRRQPDRTVLAVLRARGFTHIRLPVTAERLMAAFTDPEDIGRQLAALDSALHTLIGLGFGVSLDVHPAARLDQLYRLDPDEGFRRIDGLWRHLARRYASYSTERLFFEVLNEPPIPAGIWNDHGPRLVNVIRREAPRHTIIYGSANYQHIDALAALKPLNDANIVYAAHYYEPMIFTHQGLDWSNDPLRYLHNVPFPTSSSDISVIRLIDSLVANRREEAVALLKSQLSSPWTADRVSKAIARAANWSQLHGRHVIINEFGVLGWKANPDDRARWVNVVRRAAEVHCLGWAHWEYADGFGFVRRNGANEIPDERMMNALVGK